MCRTSTSSTSARRPRPTTGGARIHRRRSTCSSRIRSPARSTSPRAGNASSRTRRQRDRIVVPQGVAAWYSPTLRTVSTRRPSRRARDQREDRRPISGLWAASRTRLHSPVYGICSAGGGRSWQGCHPRTVPLPKRWNAVPGRASIRRPACRAACTRSRPGADRDLASCEPKRRLETTASSNRIRGRPVADVSPGSGPRVPTARGSEQSRPRPSHR